MRFNFFKQITGKPAGKILFGLMMLVFLIPIWKNKYFLTGDGPSHVYNSKVLLDYLTYHNVDFYDEFYKRNTNFEPNYFSHYALAGLLTVFPPHTAEKVLLTCYVLLFGFGLRKLLTTIYPASGFLVFPGLLFIYTHVFQMGFYNYSFSLAFYFWFAAFWLKYYQNLNPAKMLLMSSGLVLIYFTHPIGLVYALLTSGLILIADLLVQWVRAEKNRLDSFKTCLSRLADLLVISLPAMMLFAAYIFDKGLNATANHEPLNLLFKDFKNMTSLITLDMQEFSPAGWIALFMLLILLSFLIQKIVRKQWSVHDAFLIVFLFSLIIYFVQPGGMAKAGILSVRIQFLPYLTFLPWAATVQWNKWLKYSIIGIAIFFSFWLLSIRLPVLTKASNAVNEYVSVGQYIPDRSTVLPLSFEHAGKTPDGEKISNKIWLFMHAGEYVGADKSLLMLGNYEGNTGYFPIVWRYGKNPFWWISYESWKGIESQPPSADISNYFEKSGSEIDYVITWCLDDSVKDHENTQDILQQLDKWYEPVFTSENGLAVLYKHIRFPGRFDVNNPTGE